MKKNDQKVKERHFKSILMYTPCGFPQKLADF
jgi:hypothetical protein